MMCSLPVIDGGIFAGKQFGQAARKLPRCSDHRINAPPPEKNVVLEGNIFLGIILRSSARLPVNLRFPGTIGALCRRHELERVRHQNRRRPLHALAVCIGIGLEPPVERDRAPFPRVLREHLSVAPVDGHAEPISDADLFAFRILPVAIAGQREIDDRRTAVGLAQCELKDYLAGFEP